MSAVRSRGGDDFELKNRPQSASSRKGWIDNDGGGSDDVDFTRGGKLQTFGHEYRL